MSFSNSYGLRIVLLLLLPACTENVALGSCHPYIMSTDFLINKREQLLWSFQGNENARNQRTLINDSAELVGTEADETLSENIFGMSTFLGKIGKSKCELSKL